MTAKFELADPVRTDGSVEPTSNGAGEPKTYILAWTTTPWTLPGNVALAVNPEEEYVKVSIGDEKYILAKARMETLLADKEYTVVSQMKGVDLVGTAYKPIFDYYASHEYWTIAKMDGKCMVQNL